VTLSTVAPPASSAAKMKISHTGGFPAIVIAASDAAEIRIAVCAAIISLRRSIRSAIAPPNSDPITIGTSSTIPSSPTSAGECVSV
jgi:hypothetical protein